MAAEPSVLVIVLAGGEGKRLQPLTNDRAKPAVPFAGTYRLIDFALSNFANAGYLKIVVLTQYKSHSLDRHISQTWRFSAMLDNYVTPVPAQMRRGPVLVPGLGRRDLPEPQPDPRRASRHRVRVRRRPHLPDGPAPDGQRAPRERRRRHRRGDPGSQARGGRLRRHRGRTTTARSWPSTRSRRRRRRCPATTDVSRQHGQLRVRHPDADRRRDAAGEPVHRPRQPRDPGADRRPASRSVYDFSKNIVPGQDDREKGYWRDVGTIDSFFQANMDLIAPCRSSTSTTTGGRCTRR